MMLPLPWVECGEIFYGWAEPGALEVDFSVPRQCNLPEGHRGGCDWCPIYPAGKFPRPEYRHERRRRLRQERRRNA